MMPDKEDAEVLQEWNQAFDRLVPIVSIGIGTLSLALGIMMLTRPSPLAQRAYHLDGRYLVSVRYPGQWHNLQDFVQPDNPDVMAVYSQFGPDAWQLLDYVCRNISYRRDVGEFWQTPSETLARKRGDCEDTSVLLCSLLQNNAHVVIGNYQGFGHAWVKHQGQLMETTYTSARPVTDPQNYCPYVLFSDQEVIELWPGALGEVFDLRREEAQKLNLMARVLEAVA